MSSFTAFDRSSCTVTASESASSTVTLAAVHDPHGRNSSTSPDGVAVNKGRDAKIRIPSNGNADFLRLGSGDRLDLPQEGNPALVLLTHINGAGVGSDRVPAGLCNQG